MSDAQLREAEREVEGLPEALQRYRAQLLRSCSFLECWLCGVLVPEPLMPDHDKACRVQSLPNQNLPQTIGVFNSFGQFRPATPPGPTPPGHVVQTGRVGARPRRESLYDTTVIAPGLVGARPRKAIFYIRGTLDSTRISCQFLGPARDTKDSWLTNIPGSGESLPPSHAFFWYRVTLVPDVGQHAESVLGVWRNGRLRFQHQQACLLEWPCMAIMVDPKALPKCETGELAGLASVRPRADVTIAGQPVQIHGQERIEFALDAPTPPAAPVRFTVLMYGMHLRPIAGE